MNTATQQRTLVRKLHDQTALKSLHWKSDGDGDPFTQIGDYYVTVKEGRSGSGATIIRIVVEDREVNEIDSFSDEDLDDDFSTDYFDLMKELAKSSRRQAKGSDKAIDDILKKLDNL